MSFGPGTTFGAGDILVESAGIVGMCFLAGLIGGVMLWIEWCQKGRPGR